MIARSISEKMNLYYLITSYMTNRIPPRPDLVKHGYVWVYVLNNWHLVPLNIAASEDPKLIINWLYEKNIRNFEELEDLTERINRISIK
jgi:hypothetical protein